VAKWPYFQNQCRNVTSTNKQAEKYKEIFTIIFNQKSRVEKTVETFAFFGMKV
jgi:hypothetical protein